MARGSMNRDATTRAHGSWLVRLVDAGGDGCTLALGEEGAMSGIEGDAAKVVSGESKLLDKETVLALDAGEKGQRVIRVDGYRDSEIIETADRMGGQIGNDSGTHVAGGCELQ